MRDLATILNRRTFLRRGGLGLGAAALGSLLHADSPADPLAPKKPYVEPRAKSIIYMHMVGAPSQLDLLDPKPALRKWEGQACPDELLRGKRFAFLGARPTFAASPYRFSRHG